MFFFFAFLTCWACFLSVNSTLTIAMALMQQKNKKYDWQFNISVVKYAGEAATRRFSVDPKRVKDWWINQTGLQRLSEEDSNRARLPGGGRKKASEELEINVQGWVNSKWAHHERVSRKMIRAKQMYSDSRDEEFAASAGWRNRFLHRNNFTCRRQLLPRRMPENSQRS